MGKETLDTILEHIRDNREQYASMGEVDKSTED